MLTSIMSRRIGGGLESGGGGGGLWDGVSECHSIVLSQKLWLHHLGTKKFGMKKSQRLHIITAFCWG